ncbi:hypothetical protein GCM10010168_52050 [Actinoplanes ianthinogenes]|uniref:STAS domain-containing protein n=1 Tax=Actinoplanes ianthinogenes TaxID=122358 RepID=A0ABM7M3M1_9ACTN|nr:MEDS domain-containing protein [Actinoplanes ianthinogenes]BCJ46254.1 hypothetical protein Aiant_69110 [Actinoplanes ianthinogenes]GGR27396.1 hypothetical protein GCM10010168_52050 [Actinoplanes ianthinogenes]
MTAQPRRETGGDDAAPVDLRTLDPGTHLLVLYRSEADLALAAAAFVTAGLEAGDRVLYVTDDRPLPAVSAVLTAGAVTSGAFRTGQLAVCRFADVYGASDGMIAAVPAGGVRTAVARAQAEGFPGLRIVADMDDLARTLGPIERVLSWERLTARVQREEGVTSVCQYDRRRLHRDHQRLLAAEHAGAVPGWIEPPRASFLATQEGVRITGELDGFNRDECRRVVQARLATHPRLIVDVSGLTFVDTGALQYLYTIAAGLPEDGQITLAHPPPELMRMVELLGWRHPKLAFTEVA